jgi:hypothetical protein
MILSKGCWMKFLVMCISDWSPLPGFVFSQHCAPEKESKPLIWSIYCRQSFLGDPVLFFGRDMFSYRRWPQVSKRTWMSLDSNLWPSSFDLWALTCCWTTSATTVVQFRGRSLEAVGQRFRTDGCVNGDYCQIGYACVDKYNIIHTQNCRLNGNKRNCKSCCRHQSGTLWLYKGK